MNEAPLYPLLMGGVAMASLVASIFFVRFWRQTQDQLFLFFPAYAASPVTHQFAPPSISKQQEEAYNQTYTTDKAQETQLKAASGKSHG